MEIKSTLPSTPSVTSIVNGSSSGSLKNTFYFVFTIAGTGFRSNSKIVTSGALTLNTLTTVLNLAGGGYLEIFAVHGFDATSRTHRVRITIDGVISYDATSAACVGAQEGLAVVGNFILHLTMLVYINCITSKPIRFNSSCLVEYASSLTETDKTYIAYAYTKT